VMHDLRRNFGTQVVRNTDIETAREFLGHADLAHTGIYLATDNARMIEAVRKMDGVDIRDDLREVLQMVKDDKLTVEKAVKKLLKLWQSR